ncbi:MAG: PAS domain-containing sensor histidine kinase [Methanofollis sp.]|uniref:PAS domain-containing protein n=1 Tax=Methanofollis sp. TaxID=2052835 RepID=UPI0026273FF2|nr:PAS domain-containing sensor histidine kinase [Methanofollis sp.]MDD4253870.1 PAS domain-containing sensor histidine kinase [Methanofollis sp.]
MEPAEKVKQKKGPEEPVGASGGARLIRAEAEERLSRVPSVSSDLKGQTPEEIIHELQVHQIELEMQNDELRRIQHELEISRYKYLDLYDFAPVGYLTLTDKALISEANLNGAGLLGVERRKLDGARFRKFIAQGDADAWDRYFVNVLKHDEKLTTSLTLKHSDGSTFPARLESIRLKGTDGAATTVRVAISDITDIKDAEQALHDSEERYRLLLQNAHDMVFFYELTPDGSGKFLEVNDKICTTLGYTREELLAMNVSDINVPEQNERTPAILKDLFTHHHVTFETEYVAKDGHRGTVEISATLFNLRGRQTVLEIVRDITEHKRLEGALRETNKKLNLLSNITSHDINNQLLVVNGFLELLHMKVPDPELEDYFKKITSASARITAMIQFTRTYENIGVNVPVWQNIRSVITSVTTEVTPGSVVVANDLPAGTEIFADPLIFRVFYNLIQNAVQYGETITSIRFSGEERNGDYLIVGEDDGIGVPAGEKEKIFKRGFGKNTGLGLFLSREILSITGITITETGEPGKGARFEIIVPKGAYRFTGKT